MTLPAFHGGFVPTHSSPVLALHLQETGAAVALLRDAVTPEGLRSAVAPLTTSPGERRRMAQQARSLGRPDAADRLAEVLLDVATT
ncbi:hypothetical protein [Streptomyces olivaceoviridis]